MQKVIMTTPYIFLVITFSLLVIPLSLFLLISDIKEENDLIRKHEGFLP